MNKIFWEKIKKYKIVIVAHESSEGPPQELRDFLLRRRIKKILYIAHPLIYLKELYKNSSRYVVYEEGKVTKRFTSFHWRLPEPFLYAKDVLYTIFWCLKSDEQVDIFFGADPLNALSGIILRKIGKVKKVVYYSIDYTPKRFDNPIFNSCYHSIDKICCYLSDYNWVGTDRTTAARITNGVSKEKMTKVVVVPDGTHSLSIEKKLISEINMHTLVYVGFMLEKQGIDLLIESLQEIKKKIVDIRLIMVGKGPYLLTIQKKVAELGLEKFVEFKGFIQDNDVLYDILTHCAIGLAPYVEDKNSYTYYSTAGKPVLYLGCGLPVIITDVPPIAREISERKAGIMIHYKKSDLVQAVFSLLDNKKKYEEYRQNAIRFGQELDWSEIFSKACIETFMDNSL